MTDMMNFSSRNLSSASEEVAIPAPVSAAPIAAQDVHQEIGRVVAISAAERRSRWRWSD
jgi:hypothetical protein